MFLGATTATGGIAAVAVGLLAAATVHLAVGSPGGRPTTSRIRMALEGLGISVDELAPASMHPEGTLQFDATDEDGPLSVKVYGRDAWDGQLLANAWRLAWYRDTAAHRAPEPPRARRARRVRDPPRRPRRRPRAPADHRRQRRAGRRPRRRPARWRAARGLDGNGPTTRRSTRCGTTSAASTTPASPTAESTSTDSSPATTGRSASAISRRPRSPPNRPTCCRTGPRSCACRCCSSARTGPPPAARRALGDDGLLPVLPYVQEAAMPGRVRAALGATRTSSSTTCAAGCGRCSARRSSR